MTSKSLEESVANAEWETLAYMLKTLNHGVEKNDSVAKKLKAQIGMIRIITYEEMRQWNGNNSLKLSFFIGYFKSLRRMEQAFEKHGIRKKEFVIFMKLVFHRLKRQKLLAKKPLAMQAEFKKMKRVVEDGYNIL